MIEILYCPNCGEYQTTCRVDLSAPIEFYISSFSLAWVGCPDDDFEVYAPNVRELFARGQLECLKCEHPLEIRQLETCPHDEHGHLFELNWNKTERRCLVCGTEQETEQNWKPKRK